MFKDAYFFSHDTNARNDPKCSALIHEYGPEGYGVFWMMIETLSEQSDYKLTKFPKLYEGLAAQFRIEHGRLRSIIEALLRDYELLLEDEKYIWSASLLRRMQIKEKKKQQKIEAGRKGGLKSGVSRRTVKQNEAPLEAKRSSLEANEPKESKVKESKRKETTTTDKDNFEIIQSFYEENFLEPVPPVFITRMIEFTDQGMDIELILKAIEKSIGTERPTEYCKGILKKWLDKGIKKIDEYDEESSASVIPIVPRWGKVDAS